MTYIYIVEGVHSNGNSFEKEYHSEEEALSAAMGLRRDELGKQFSIKVKTVTVTENVIEEKIV